MLKSVDQVLKPDPLVASTCGRDGRAPLTVEEHHYAVAQITLSNSVPAVAGEAFDRARNAFLYAWFSYDLGALAEAQAIFSVELALRQRLGERAHSRDTIANLQIGIASWWVRVCPYGKVVGVAGSLKNKN